MQADTPHYFYGHYYAAQAMFLAGGKYWAQWYPAIRDELIARQNPDLVLTATESSDGYTGTVPEQVAAILAISLSLIYLKGAGEPIPIRMMIAILAGLGLSVLIGTALMAFFFLRNESSRRDAASGKTENDD